MSTTKSSNTRFSINCYILFSWRLEIQEPNPFVYKTFWCVETFLTDKKIGNLGLPNALILIGNRKFYPRKPFCPASTNWRIKVNNLWNCLYHLDFISTWNLSSWTNRKGKKWMKHLKCPSIPVSHYQAHIKGKLSIQRTQHVWDNRCAK